MNAWLRQHAEALARAAAGSLKGGGLLSALVIGIALALPAGGYALLESVRGVGERVVPEAQLAVYLKPEAQRGAADALGAALRADRRVAQARFVSREEALKNLRSDPALAEVVAALGHNPLPDGYVVTARSRDAAGLEALAADLRNMAGVAHVQSDAQWARRLSALVGIGRLALWLLAAVLGIGLIAVTFNTIRLQILTRREEIEVSKLLGATDAFIRRPFYYLGLVQGLAGGMVALAIVAAGLAALNREVGALADSYGSSFRFAFPPAGDAAAIVLFAALIGWLGAYLSVGRELRQLD